VAATKTRTPKPTTETTPEVAVAVLFERLGHVMEKVDNLSMKLDEQDARRSEHLKDLEARVAQIESQVSGVRWFLAGVAIAGGAIGGSVAAGVAKALGLG
jgi:hypothetical protein